MLILVDQVSLLLLFLRDILVPEFYYRYLLTPITGAHFMHMHKYWAYGVVNLETFAEKISNPVSYFPASFKTMFSAINFNTES